MFNAKPKETAPVPVPAAGVPDMGVIPSESVPVPAAAPAPVAGAPETTAAPAAVAAAKAGLPQTKSSTPGGWNRFAGYNRNDAKNKPKKPSRRF
jgi:hypothetical protein